MKVIQKIVRIVRKRMAKKGKEFELDNAIMNIRDFQEEDIGSPVIGILYSQVSVYDTKGQKNMKPIVEQRLGVIKIIQKSYGKRMEEKIMRITVVKNYKRKCKAISENVIANEVGVL